MPVKNSQNAQNEQNASVKTSASGGISFDQYKKMLINHYSHHPLYATEKPMPSVEQMRQNYDNMSDAELIKEYNMYLEQNRLDWEMNALQAGINSGVIPKWILNTSNAELINQFINENYRNLSYEQQYLLNYRIAVAGVVSNIQTQAKESFEQGKPFLPLAAVKEGTNANNEPSYELEGVSQYGFQSSNNGCWSCFFQVLASSRGVYAPQEQIRSCKPNLSEESAKGLADEAFRALNYDQMNSALEMGDSILSYLPNTMLCEMEISSYDATIAARNITPEQYLRSCTEQIRKTIVHAIRDEHSPVGVLLGNHYITIVGIEGDKVKFKNSMPDDAVNPYDPDYTFEAPISELFSGVLLNDDGMTSALQLTYAKEIKLSKDGRTIFGVPSDYVKMFPDGTLSRQPSEIRDGAHLLPDSDPPSNICGMQVARTGRVEDTPSEQKMRDVLVNGVLFTEKVYIPKQLELSYLKNGAKNRTLEEENALRRQDEEFFGNRRPALSQAELDAENLLAAQGNQQPEEISRELFEQANSTDTLQREAAAKERIKDLTERSRAACIKRAFEKLAAGAHRSLYGSQLIRDQDFKIEKLDIDQAKQLQALLVKAMGTDSNNALTGEIYAVYDKFIYQASPDAEPINVAQAVEQRLRNAKSFGDTLSEGTLYAYVAAELLHLAANPAGSLRYDNNEYSVADLKLRAVPELAPELRIQNANQPVNEHDFRLAYDIRKLDIPQVSDESFYAAVVGLSPEQLRAYAAVYDEIFGKGQQGNVNDLTINIIPEGKPGYPREDTHFYSLHTYQRANTDPAAYNREVWNKQKTFENGKTLLSAEPGILLQASKAGIVIALANGMTVKKNGVPVGRLSLVAADRARQKQLTDSMTARDLAFLGSRGGKAVPTSYTLENLRTTLNAITADIESADNRWFRSSDYYREVKKSLKALNKHVNDTLTKKFERGRPISFEDMEAFFDKSDALRGKMTAYLDHKARQLLRDPARKYDPDKQDHEQLRIRNMIRSIENLDAMTQRAEKSVLDGMTADAKRYFKEQYEQALLKTRDSNLEGLALEACYAECADRLDQLDDDFYTRRNKYRAEYESLREARDRIIGAVNKKYDQQFAAQSRDKAAHFVHYTANEARLIYESAEHRKPGDRELRGRFRHRKQVFLDSYTTYRYEKDKLAAYQADLVAYQADEAQARTYGNATALSGRQAAAIEVYDNILGLGPNLEKAFPDPKERPITKAEFARFKPIQGRLRAIGNAGPGKSLSSKDFAAIAYAACFTDRAYEKLPSEHRKSPVREISMFQSHKMITLLDSDGHRDLDKTHGAMLQEGRIMAKEAMAQYAQGSKQMLAELLTAGLKKTSMMFKMNPGSITSSNTELAARMKNMLDRDPELKAIAEEKGLKPEDIKRIESMKKLWQIYENAEAFTNKHNAKASYTEDEQIDGVTDCFIRRLIYEQQLKAKKERRTADPVYVKEFNDTYHKLVKEINTSGAKDPEAVCARMNEKIDYLDYIYPPKTPLLDSLDAPEKVDVFRSLVREMVKNSTLNVPFTEASRAFRKIGANCSFEEVLKNYKEAPETEDGKYRIADEDGFVDQYKLAHKAEINARRAEKDFDVETLNELRYLVKARESRKKEEKATGAVNSDPNAIKESKEQAVNQLQP